MALATQNWSYKCRRIEVLPESNIHRKEGREIRTTNI